MTHLPYTLTPDDPAVAPMGLIVLQTDETLELEFRHYFAEAPNPIYVSRIASAPEVSAGSLAEMQTQLTASAHLLPKARHYAVIGYGCTSASAVIGSDAVEKMVQAGAACQTVTNPLRAGIACSQHHGLSRLALLSPYVEEVNDPLRTRFSEAGIEMDIFGTFAEPNEANVVRISQASIIESAIKLGSDPQVDGIFISCTNLHTRLALPEIEKQIGKPALSSNQCLAWHMLALTQS